MNPEFEFLLDYLRHHRGFDFTGYKRSSLMRRVQKRMQMIEIDSYSNYMDYLEVHPQEFVHLFNTILINVTSFYRDSTVWDYIRTDVIPQIAARKDLQEPIRVWSAGCATGQEAYTLAIALAEALGLERFKSHVKIYATDVDEEALNQARYAAYNAREVSCLSPEILKQYFECSDNLYTFSKDLRRSIIFGRHDLVQDAPISRIDLLVCRNTLMYFNAEAQAKIVNRFHFALQDGGFLLLGKAEMLLSQSNSFIPIDLKRRIFTKLVSKTNQRDRLLLMSKNNSSDRVAHQLSIHEQIRDAAFDITPIAQIVVDGNGILTLANKRARALFGLTRQDLGRLVQDLEISYPLVELRSCIAQVYVEHQPIHHQEVEWTNTSGDNQYFDVQIAPLWDFNSTPLGVSITFIDVTRSKRLQDELENSNQELAMAYEELHSTNEEFETTNEELQSSNEELETTNEELQSTNEELETMNEELHSSNEELQTINEELQLRSEEINSLNAFLAAILSSLRCGVVVLDRDLHIQIWSSKTEDLWGLRNTEVAGQHLLNLDIGLPVEQLKQPIRTCLAGDSDYITLSVAINRRGKNIQCQVTCTPLRTITSEIQGIIMLMEEKDSQESP